MQAVVVVEPHHQAQALEGQALAVTAVLTQVGLLAQQIVAVAAAAVAQTLVLVALAVRA